jgi:hypothetical protein
MPPSSLTEVVCPRRIAGGLSTSSELVEAPPLSSLLGELHPRVNLLQIWPAPHHLSSSSTCRIRQAHHRTPSEARRRQNFATSPLFLPCRRPTSSMSPCPSRVPRRMRCTSPVFFCQTSPPLTPVLVAGSRTFFGAGAQC